ncbi:MAG: hypothetical protein WKF87_17875 [Chryseolinea sp.]
MSDYTPDNDLATLGLGDERVYIADNKTFSRLKAIFFGKQFKIEDGVRTEWDPSYHERLWNWCYHSEYVPLWAGTRMKLGLFPPLSIYKRAQGKSIRAQQENLSVQMVNDYVKDGRAKNKTHAVKEVADYFDIDPANVWQYLRKHEDRHKQDVISIIPQSLAEFEILKDFVITNYPNQLSRNGIPLL